MFLTVGGGGRLFAPAVFPMLIALVMTLVADISSPRHGLIGPSQQPPVDFRQTSDTDGHEK